MSRRCALVLAGTLLVPTAAADDFEVVRIATGLEQPVYVTTAPGDDSRLYIVEANSGGSSGDAIARIKILYLTGPSAGTLAPTPFLEIGNIPQVEDQGLFNLVFHPRYPRNGFFYVTYANAETDCNGAGDDFRSQVVRYEVSANPDVADPSSATTIFEYCKPFFNHNGDWLGFSPTDLSQDKYYLYHTTGDGGSNQDPQMKAQDLTLKHGKVLRVDVGKAGLADGFPGDPDETFRVPLDNPFAGMSGVDETIWARGLRNPWRASFDRVTGDLYIANVGANLSDEVEFQPYDSSGGENYGWSQFEGTFEAQNYDPPAPPVIDPMYECKHAGGSLTDCPKRSITGGYVYRGPVQSLQGEYIFGDFLGTYDFGSQTGSAQLFSTRHDGSDPATFDGTNITGGVVNRTADFAPDAGSFTFVSSFGEDEAGNLYIVDMGNLGTPDGLGKGEIFKICGICEVCLPGRPTVPDFCPLQMLRWSDVQTMQWNPAADAAVYDVVKGDLTTLRATRGDFAAAIGACLDNDGTDAEAPETAFPIGDEGFFYLVRGIDASGSGGTYDSGGAAQAGFRDGEIYAASATCP